jgi:hypothetical protein
MVMVNGMTFSVGRMPATYSATSSLDKKNRVVLFWCDGKDGTKAIPPCNGGGAFFGAVAPLVSDECFPTVNTLLFR